MTAEVDFLPGCVPGDECPLRRLAAAAARCSKFSMRAAVPSPLSEAEEVALPPTGHPGIYQSYPISGSSSAVAVVCSGNSA